MVDTLAQHSPLAQSATSWAAVARFASDRSKGMPQIAILDHRRFGVVRSRLGALTLLP
jgi:hypothetical protein